MQLAGKFRFLDALDPVHQCHEAGKTVAASGGWGAAIGLSLLAIVVLVVTVIFVTDRHALVIIGKVALFILLGLGRLFIAMALFDFTSALFSGWLRTCAQYAIVPMIVYAILGFLLTLMNQTITNSGSSRTCRRA